MTWKQGLPKLVGNLGYFFLADELIIYKSRLFLESCLLHGKSNLEHAIWFHCVSSRKMGWNRSYQWACKVEATPFHSKVLFSEFGAKCRSWWVRRRIWIAICIRNDVSHTCWKANRWEEAKIIFFISYNFFLHIFFYLIKISYLNFYLDLKKMAFLKIFYLCFLNIFLLLFLFYFYFFIFLNYFINIKNKNIFYFILIKIW